jgi:hypothetical protein
MNISEYSITNTHELFKYKSGFGIDVPRDIRSNVAMNLVYRLDRIIRHDIHGNLRVI